MGALHARVARGFGLTVSTVDPFAPADHATVEAAGHADVAAVAVPIPDLATAAMAVIEAGCPRILVEKPMAASWEEGRALAAAAEAAGAQLFVGFTERFNPLMGAVANELLDRVGTPARIEFERRGPAPREHGHGPGLDLAVHDIDLLRFLGFEPVLTGSRSEPLRFEASFECGDATAHVLCAYEDRPRLRRLRVDGDRGSLECDLVAQVARLTGADGVGVVTAGGPEPLAGQWAALLAGTGPDAADGLAALELVLNSAVAEKR